MHTVQLLVRLVEHHEALVYALIFLGMVLEGEFVLLCTGILIHLGVLYVPVTLIAVLAGALTKTLLGYYIGRSIDKKWGKTKFLLYVEKHARKIVPHFYRKPFWSIFISKFLMVNHIVIIFAGMKRVSVRKYLRAEVISTLIWAPGLLFLGYFFSAAALHVSHNISQFTLIVIILVALFLILDKIVSWAYQLFEEFHENIQ
jgi:membrane-associated protein